MNSETNAVPKKCRFFLPGLLLAVFLLMALQRLLMPKYLGKVVEGNFTGEYYRETAPHQLLILGDCEAYENISPVTLWRNYGISSYIRGNANQLPVQSYYLLKEALETETPKVVLFSVSALQERAQTNETYNRMTLDGMRWSGLKAMAVRDSKLPDEYYIEYIFPLLRFHDRWKELNGDDLRFFLPGSVPAVTHNGYYLRADIRPAGELPPARRLADPMLPASSVEWLDRIREICEEKNITLVLFKAPSILPVWYEEWDAQIREYAFVHGLMYVNCLADSSAAGIDYSRDTYDGGMHMNVYGAEKVADHLGAFLVKNGCVSDQRGDPLLQDLYSAKAEVYDRIKKEQENEFAELGYLRQFSDSAD